MRGTFSVRVSTEKVERLGQQSSGLVRPPLRYTFSVAIRQPSPPPLKPPTRPKWQSKYHGVRMTPEQYLALPDEKPYLEYIDGMVVQKPMPNEHHAPIALEVGYHIRLWLRGKKGRAGVEARAKLGDLPNYRLPDVSFWKAGVPAGDEAPPTLAVESCLRTSLSLSFDGSANSYGPPEWRRAG